MRLRLTAKSVEGLKPTDRQTKIWDTTMPGFGVRVNGNSKSWIIMYGQERRLKTLGRYPALSLADARAKARAFLEAPKTNQLTFAQVVEQFLDTYSEHHHSPRTGREAARLLRKHFAPLNKKPIDDITTADITKITDGLLRTPSEATHSHRTVRVLLRWATRRGLIQTNPIADLPAPAPDKVRDRVLTDDELKSLWEARTGVFGDIWALLLITGQRRAQIANLRRSWLLEDAIDFPANIMKGKKPHTLPIGQFAWSIIAKHPQPTELVFPGRDDPDKPWNGWGRCTRAMNATAGVSDYVLHDLRRTYATIMQRIGVPLHVVEKLLAHQSGSFSGIVGVYQRHQYLDEMREAVATYESHLKKLIGG